MRNLFTIDEITIQMITRAKNDRGQSSKCTTEKK